MTPGGTTTGTYDAQDRIATYGTLSFGYNVDGEITSRTDSSTSTTTTYAYDDYGRLASAVLPGGTTISYVVDATGRRIGRRVNGVLTQEFLYADRLRPIAELDGAGAIVSTFVYGTRSNLPAFMVRGGTTYRIVSDHLGSVRAVIDVATGTIAQRMDFDEFGNVLLDSNPGF